MTGMVSVEINISIYYLLCCHLIMSYTTSLPGCKRYSSTQTHTVGSSVFLFDSTVEIQLKENARGIFFFFFTLVLPSPLISSVVSRTSLGTWCKKITGNGAVVVRVTIRWLEGDMSSVFDNSSLMTSCTGYLFNNHRLVLSASERLSIFHMLLTIT